MFEEKQPITNNLRSVQLQRAANVQRTSGPDTRQWLAALAEARGVTPVLVLLEAQGVEAVYASALFETPD